MKNKLQIRNPIIDKSLFRSKSPYCKYPKNDSQNSKKNKTGTEKIKKFGGCKKWGKFGFNATTGKAKFGNRFAGL